MLLPFTVSLHGAEVQTGSGSARYLKNFMHVPVDVARTIFTSTKQGSPRAWLLWGAIGTSFLVDEQVRDEWRRNISSRELDKVSRVLYVSGTPEFGASAIISGLAGSWALRQQDTLYTFTLIAQSALLSQAIAETVKLAAGRVRPRSSDGDSMRWQESDNKSFFSGHAAGVWSAATVFAHRYPDNMIIPPLAYGWATSVSLSRINDDGHWLSDVMVGSIVGYMLGRSVVDLNTRPDNASWTVTPVIGDETAGVSLTMLF